MKKLSSIIIIVIFSLLKSQFLYSQSTIARVTVDSGFKITIKGYASKDLWLGCTLNYDTYNETNLGALKVMKGNFSEQFNAYSALAKNLARGNSSIPYVVALWEEKINLRECEKRYGKGSERCKWARLNTYQLEGRVFRKTGELTF
jgi:hypothetical protein